MDKEAIKAVREEVADAFVKKAKLSLLALGIGFSIIQVMNYLDKAKKL